MAIKGVIDDSFMQPNAVHDAQRLKELQALPLERKIMITQTRIMEFVNAMGGPENVIVSYSGGKDSTVLLHICRQLYPEMKAVYADTGLEYPEVRAMAKKNGAVMVRPKMRFDRVIYEYGYPLVSKEVSEAIYYARKIRNGRNAKAEEEKPNENGYRVNNDGEPYGARGGETIRRRGDLDGTRKRYRVQEDDAGCVHDEEWNQKR